MGDGDLTSYYGYNAREIVRRFTQYNETTADLMAAMGKFVEYMDTTDVEREDVYGMTKLTRTFPIRHLKIDLTKFYDTGLHRFLSYLNLKYTTKLTLTGCSIEIHPTPPSIVAMDVESLVDLSPFRWAFRNENIRYLRQTHGNISEEDLVNIARRDKPLIHLHCTRVDLVNKDNRLWRAALRNIICLELDHCHTHPEDMKSQEDVDQYAPYEKHPRGYDLNNRASSRDPRTQRS